MESTKIKVISGIDGVTKHLNSIEFLELKDFDIKFKFKKQNAENEQAIKLAFNNLTKNLADVFNKLDNDLSYLNKINPINNLENKFEKGLSSDTDNVIPVNNLNKPIVDIVDGCTCLFCTIVNKIYYNQKLTKEEREVHPFKIALKIATLQYNNVITEEQFNIIAGKIDDIYGNVSTHLK